MQQLSKLKRIIKNGRIELNKNRLLYYPKGSNKCYDVYWSELEKAIISYCKNRWRKRSLLLLPEKIRKNPRERVFLLVE